MIKGRQNGEKQTKNKQWAAINCKYFAFYKAFYLPQLDHTEVFINPPVAKLENLLGQI